MVPTFGAGEVKFDFAGLDDCVDEMEAKKRAEVEEEVKDKLRAIRDSKDALGGLPSQSAGSLAFQMQLAKSFKKQQVATAGELKKEFLSRKKKHKNARTAKKAEEHADKKATQRQKDGATRKQKAKRKAAY